MDVEEPSAFAELLRDHRAAAGLTQEALAERSELSARGVGDLERGAKRHPHRETVRRLANALGLTGEERDRFAAAAARAPLVDRTGPGWDADPFAGVVAASRFIGRARDLERLSAWLREPGRRWTTVTGPGGVGKTRLAVEGARRTAGGFPARRWFVDLTLVARPAHVVPAIAGVVAPGWQDDPATAVVRRLNGRSGLLLLDNGEHVLDAGPEIARLIDRSPGLRVLATSRERFGLRVEQEWPLAPMTVPDQGGSPDLDRLAGIESVALFLDRVAAVDPGFVLTDQNAAAVVAVCGRLDGLPLAIELAAARSKLLPPPELARRLGRRLHVLNAGARDLPDRHRTLRDSIAWSHDLLSAKERRAFRWLAVFAGGWTLAFAEEVLGADAPPDVATLVGSLLDKSLVVARPQADGSLRFAMLETIREYALEQLASSGDETAARDAHARAFRRLAEAHQPSGLEAPSADPTVAGEALNILAALTWEITDDRFGVAIDRRVLVAALSNGWMSGADARRWLEGLLAGEAATDRRRVKVLLSLGELAWINADYGGAEAASREGVRVAAAAGDRRLEMRATAMLGGVTEHAGNDVAAKALYERTLALARSIDDPYWAAHAAMNLADTAYRNGEFDRIEPLADEALAGFRALGVRYDAALTLCTLAYLAIGRRALPDAASLLAEALDDAVACGDRWVLADVVAACAGLASGGDPAGAARLLGAADTLLEEEGSGRLAHQFQRDVTLAAARERLGPTADTEIAAGREWSADVSVAEARRAIAGHLDGGRGRALPSPAVPRR